MRLIRAALFTLAALVSFGLALGFLAQPVAAQDDPWDRLYASLEAGTVQQAGLNSTLDNVARAILRSNPYWRNLESENRGLLAEMMEAIRPSLINYSERVSLAYRPRIVEEIRGVLTAEEAASAADFYASDLGQLAISSAVNNLRLEQVIGEVLSGKAVTADAVNQDFSQAAVLGFAAMTPQQRDALNRAMATVPGLAKMELVMERIAPIRAQMEAEPPLPEEERALEAALQGLARSYGL